MMRNQHSRYEDDGVDFAKAKDLSLTAFIQAELGVEPKKATAGWVRFSACPACGPGPKASVRLAIHPDDRSWKCQRCGEHGSIIDAGMKLWGCKNFEAVKKLLGVSDAPRPAARAYDHEAAAAQAAAKAALMRRAFAKLQEACQAFRDQPQCLSYLVDERKIPEAVVREAQRRGMVGFMPTDHDQAKRMMVDALGESLLREAGLWKVDKRLPGIAYRPLVFFMPGLTSAEFRTLGSPPEGWSKSIAYGSKEYPYWWLGDKPECAIAEGFPDVMASVALGWRGHVMGVPGCNNIRKEWLQKAFVTYRLQRYVIALDNDVEVEDNPGQTWSAKIAEWLNEMKIPYIHKSPDRGDLNDLLKVKVQQKMLIAA